MENSIVIITNPLSLAIASLLLLLLSASFSTSSPISTSCMSSLQSLTPCSSALPTSSGSGSATTTTPARSCCEPLLAVLSNATQFSCLCSLLSNTQYQAMLQAALRLPQLCHLPIIATEANCTTLVSSGSPSDDQSVVTSSSTSSSISVGFFSSLFLSSWICVGGFFAMAPFLS